MEHQWHSHLPQYHPWNTLKTGDAILDELKADIICFQEMKTTRLSLPRTLAVPSTYDSFFSFPTNKTGYSGVGTYTGTLTARPLKAEEGLTGLPRNGGGDERISQVYPRADDLAPSFFPDEEGNTPSDLGVLDTEGRCLTLDFGLFVLINTYCPNETSDARLPYKMNYHLLLQSRVEQLIREGREVIVLGDLNVCVGFLDHCDGHLESVREGFWEHPARAWAKGLFGEGGVLVDVVRMFWPDRKAMYTCWNTRISARESNYGTRVDYILVTRGLLPWIKAADIEPSVKGSDHCPIWVDLREEVELGGRVERLRDVMFCNGVEDGCVGREPPRLAARYWEEYSGRQTLLSTFFGKGGSAGGNKDVASPFSKVDAGKTKCDVGDMEVSVGELSNTLAPTPPNPNTDREREPTQPPPSAPSTPPQPPPSSIPPTFSSPAPSPAPTPQQPPTTHPRAPSLAQYPHEPKKRKQPDEPSSSKSKKKKAGQKPKQTKLSTFFVQPSTSSTGSSSGPNQTQPSKDEEQEQLEADYKLALELSASQQDLLSQAHPTPAPKQNTNQAQAWSHLLSPLQPPLCFIHKEPTKELTVTKPGPNKGKNFFICSRPVGPGYDRGRGERLREEVNHLFRCGFFRWGSEVRRDALREGAGAGARG